MTANVNAVFPIKPNTQGVQLTTGTARSDGTGTIATDMFLVGVLNGTDGSRLKGVRLMQWASAASTVTTANVARLYLSTKAAGATTPADTRLLAEVAVPSVTAAHPTAPVGPIDFLIDKSLLWEGNTAVNVLVSIHTTPAANTGIAAVMDAGDYSLAP